MSQGFTVSTDGFMAVVSGKDSARAMRIAMTPDDPMSGGLDVEAAETSEARTLLQLMQVRVLWPMPPMLSGGCEGLAVRFKVFVLKRVSLRGSLRSAVVVVGSGDCWLLCFVTSGLKDSEGSLRWPHARVSRFVVWKWWKMSAESVLAISRIEDRQNEQRFRGTTPNAMAPACSS